MNDESLLAARAGFVADLRRSLIAGIVLASALASPWAVAQEEAEDGARNGAPNGVIAPSAARASQRAKFLADRIATQNAQAVRNVPCVGGFADIYPCANVDLLAFIPLSEFVTNGNIQANDIWGWTDSATGREYALLGVWDGTAIFDITDPVHPVYLGGVPTQSLISQWRDIKVYDNHAYIVSEAFLNHGMQVFDLTRLRNVVNPPVSFAADAVYQNFGSGAHNIVINEDSGFAYAVGTNSCSGGLHMIDIQVPASPTFAGCFSQDGYTHDAHCVNYTGADPDHQGKEICFNANEDAVTIADVTNKAAPVQLSRTTYPGSRYTHQGWLTEDHSLFLFNDELDELGLGHNTRTRILDVSDLDAPTLVGSYDGPTPSIDHNLYVKGDTTYEANYRSGLAIIDSSGAASGNLSEIGHFDVYPADDDPDFNGAWSVYPYFDSGVIVVSGIEQGLFVLRPRLPGVFTIGNPIPGVAGVENDLQISGASAGGQVFLAVGGSAGSTPAPIPECPGLSVDIASAKLLAQGTAGAGGNLVVSQTVPLTAAGKVVRIQGVDRASCTTSNVAVVGLE